jgi:hypothetical protein
MQQHVARPYTKRADPVLGGSHLSGVVGKGIATKKSK